VNLLALLVLLALLALDDEGTDFSVLILFNGHIFSITILEKIL